MSSSKPTTFGIVGLGKIGGSLALQALEKGYEVAGLDKREIQPELKVAGIVNACSVSGLADALSPPRIVLLYVPAGAVVDTILGELEEELSEGDVIVDGGNSYWGDSIRRHEWLQKRGLHFIDVGTSGGVSGARHGACFMAGGHGDAISVVKPLFLDLAVEGGWVHAGGPGAGHYVKLVHNGIEFGMLQAIAEGVDLLEHFHEKLPIADVLHAWRNGSVIRSWLIDLMEEGYRETNLRVPAYVEDTGEVNWLVDDALHMGVPIPAIASSVMQLIASRHGDKNWARAVALMRHGFGEHPFGADEDIAKERKHGRVGPYVEKAAECSHARPSHKFGGRSPGR